MELNHEAKEQIVNAVWVNGTLESATSKDITMESIQAEMKRSAVFKKRIRKALEESKGMLIDEARALVRDYMRGKYDKTDRNRLTAAIALLNAYEPGFKGATTVLGKIQHDVRVITAVPRPKYDEVEGPKVRVSIAPTKEDKAKLRALNEGRPINMVETIIEGEVIKESE